MVRMSSRSHTSRRPAWADLRFLVGVVLVLASVGGVWFIVSSARQTDPVYVAVRAIVPGEPVAAADLAVVDVALGVASNAYLRADDLGEGFVAARTVSAGELVPADALVTDDSTRSTTVVVRSAAEVPGSVVAGSTVELWAAPRLDQSRFDTPRILVADATVVSVTRDDSPLAGGTAAVELVIPRADVAAALAAIADGSALSVIPWTPGQQ